MTRSLSGYGADFELRLSKAQAEDLLAPHPLPKMGSETLMEAAADSDYSCLFHTLWVQNISGNFVLACASAKRDDWLDIFKQPIPA